MLSFIRITKPPYHWLINQAHRKLFEEHFIGKESLIYDALRENILKDNNARTIFTIEIPGLNILVKRYKIKGLLEIIKATFFSNARREVRLADYLIRHHINTVYPLGVLEKKKFGFTTDVFVLLRKIPDVLPIKDLSFSSLPIKSKDNLLKAVSKLGKEVHQVKFFHKDLHIGNILIEPTSLKAESPILYLIDLHRCSVLSYFTQSHKIYNLAQMVYSLSTILPLTDAYRFIKYYRGFDFRKNILRDFIRTIFNKAQDLRHKHWQSRNKRCLRNSSTYKIQRFKSLKSQEYKIIYKSAHFSQEVNPVKTLMELISEHNQLVTNEPNKLFKLTHSHLISNIKNVFIKEYRYSFSRRVLSLFGIHPAKREWFAVNGLLVRRVLTTEPVALIEEITPFFNWVRRSYVITQEVNAQPTNQYLMDNFITRIRNKEALKRKVRFIKEFAYAIKRLHQKGIFHYDLKANNILIENKKNDKRFPSFSFYFIDLDHLKFSMEVSLQEWIKNLSQLNAAVTDVMTKTDRLRFYRFYSYGEINLPPAREKGIIKQIMKATIKRHHFWPPQ